VFFYKLQTAKDYKRHQQVPPFNREWTMGTEQGVFFLQITDCKRL